MRSNSLAVTRGKQFTQLGKIPESLCALWVEMEERALSSLILLPRASMVKKMGPGTSIR